MLIDHADPGADRVPGSFELGLSPLDPDMPAVRSKHPGQDAHKRTLARAVLPQKGQNASGPDIQAYIPVGLNAAEGFANIFQGNQGDFFIFPH